MPDVYGDISVISDNSDISINGLVGYVMNTYQFKSDSSGVLFELYHNIPIGQLIFITSDTDFDTRSSDRYS
jgi:hypothetical protein